MNEDYYHEQNSCYDSNSFGFDQFQSPQYTVNHPIFNAQNEFLNSQNKLMEQITSICDMVGQFMQKKEEERRIVEEQAAKDRYWKIPICYDDDEDYTIAITPILSTNELVDYLIMEDEHLDTIPATKSDEIIKYGVENLVPIPSGSKGVSDDICDNDHSDAESLLSQDILITSPKIDFLLEEFTSEFTLIPPGMDKDEFDEEGVDCYDHDISSDDDSYENIEYVEASPLNLEYDRLEEENEDQEEKEFDLEDIFQIQDVILHEKLLNVHRLITNIESLKNNPTPDFVLKSPSSIPISVTDSDSFFEESDTSLSHSDNSLPEFETFSDHTEETRSGSTTTHANYSLPEYDSFLFEIEPNQGGLTSVVIFYNSNNPLLEFPEFESFHFDLDPLIPRPPPEPPDVEKCLEPEEGILITKVFKGVSKPHDFMADILPTLVSDLTFIHFLSFILPPRSEANHLFDPGTSIDFCHFFLSRAGGIFNERFLVSRV
ncbi:hypothetical protein Tco_0011866 [Tanacetum coccineum]